MSSPNSAASFGQTSDAEDAQDSDNDTTHRDYRTRRGRAEADQSRSAHNDERAATDSRHEDDSEVDPEDDDYGLEDDSEHNSDEAESPADDQDDNYKESRTPNRSDAARRPSEENEAEEDDDFGEESDVSPAASVADDAADDLDQVFDTQDTSAKSANQRTKPPDSVKAAQAKESRSAELETSLPKTKLAAFNKVTTTPTSRSRSGLPSRSVKPKDSSARRQPDRDIANEEDQDDDSGDDRNGSLEEPEHTEDDDDEQEEEDEQDRQDQLDDGDDTGADVKGPGLDEAGGNETRSDHGLNATDAADRSAVHESASDNESIYSDRSRTPSSPYNDDASPITVSASDKGDDRSPTGNRGQTAKQIAGIESVDDITLTTDRKRHINHSNRSSQSSFDQSNSAADQRDSIVSADERSQEQHPPARQRSSSSTLLDRRRRRSETLVPRNVDPDPVHLDAPSTKPPSSMRITTSQSRSGPESVLPLVARKADSTGSDTTDTKMIAQANNAIPRSVSDNALGAVQPPPQEKNDSTQSKFNFFGWKSTSSPPKNGQLDTPSASCPGADRLDRSTSAPRLTPMAIDTRADSNYYASPLHDSAPRTPSAAVVADLERELREITQELAGSIRREMELEDEVDRLKLDNPGGMAGALTHRTSGYFSDSGTSSTKYSATDGDTKLDDLEKSKRKLEQEKATIRADFSTRLTDEQRQRRELEEENATLQDELRTRLDQTDRGDSHDERIKELETFLDESRRRLTQERQSRDNFEDLLAALRVELAQDRSERNNLRDEIVPQLKARIEGLELEAADAAKLHYETTSSQQDMSRKQSRDGPLTDSSARHNFSRLGGVSRTNSLQQSEGSSRQRDMLQRSGSVKARGEQTDVMTGDRIKDVEDQRDALQKALKHLIKRHEHERREHTKQIQKLISEGLSSPAGSPSRSTFSRDVRTLRDEMSTLRKRADEALMQKWQCETSLGGVKLALDRAEQETRALRLQLMPTQGSATPLREHQDDYDSEHDGASSTGSKTLHRGAAVAERERDNARREAATYRAHAQNFDNSRDAGDQARAEQLFRSADHLEALAAQMDRHLETNEDLSSRLVQCVSKGEHEQTSSTARIVELQSRLKAMEEGVVAAQQQSESNLSIHEDEARQLGTQRPQLHRLQAVSPVSAGLSSAASISPRLAGSSRGKAESLFEASKTSILQRRVREMEQYLTDADVEMKAVVAEINHSHGEIAKLQTERDDSARHLRKLQSDIFREEQKVSPLLD